MISYRWLASGGFARRRALIVSPRSVTDSKGQALWRRPRRPLRSIPCPQAKLNTKEKIPTFFHRTHAQTCPTHRSNPQDLGAGGQEFRGAELKKADSCCPYPLRQPAAPPLPEAGKPRSNARAGQRPEECPRTKSCAVAHDFLHVAGEWRVRAAKGTYSFAAERYGFQRASPLAPAAQAPAEHPLPAGKAQYERGNPNFLSSHPRQALPGASFKSAGFGRRRARVPRSGTKKGGYPAVLTLSDSLRLPPLPKAGKPRGNAHGRNHVQLPMISYRWLASGGFARRRALMVSPRSVIGFLRSELLKRRPRRPEEARFSCFFLEFHIVELLPPRRQSLSGKRSFLRFSSAPTPKLARRIVQIRRIWAQAGKSSAERN